MSSQCLSRLEGVGDVLTVGPAACEAEAVGALIVTAGLSLLAAAPRLMGVLVSDGALTERAGAARALGGAVGLGSLGLLCVGGTSFAITW